MSILKNLLNNFVPIRERREASGTLNTNGAEIVFSVNGDENVTWAGISSAFIGTIEFAGSVDGTNFYPLPAYPLAVASVGGTIPLSGQPLLSIGLVAANTNVVYVQPCGQFRSVRCRVTAYTSGTLAVVANADTQTSANSAVVAKPSTLLVTATAAVSVAATATLPAVAGLRHVLDFISVTRSATAALTASATPVLVTTTNLPGNPALTFGADAAGIGIDKEVKLDFGATGLAASALGTATTVVAPVYTGVIWRITVGYRLGV
jgi:hypothetical protein